MEEISQLPITNLIRWGGLAAIIAGILRGINSLLPSATPTVAIAALYLLTDIFILFGMMGLYGFQCGGVEFFMPFLTLSVIRRNPLS
jgi:hypothetical protein